MNSREEMVEEMREKYGLDAPAVFSAMLKVPREKFVSKKLQSIAYQDRPIPIGQGQTMSQPYTVAFMTNLLELKGKEKVLEIGTGSGYQAAVLSYLAKEVYTIEIIDSLASQAKKRLKKLGYQNVAVKKGSGQWGWQDNAPFDAILVTAGISGDVPEPLLDQLKENGVLVAPVGRGHDKQMTRLVKKKNRFKKEKFGVFTFVPFVEEKN